MKLPDWEPYEWGFAACIALLIVAGVLNVISAGPGG